MHRQPQQHSGQTDPLMYHGPEKSHDHDAQQTFGTSARADRGHHRVEQPNRRKLERSFSSHAAACGRLEHQHNEPSRNDVRKSENYLAE